MHDWCYRHSMSRGRLCGNFRRQSSCHCSFRCAWHHPLRSTHLCEQSSKACLLSRIIRSHTISVLTHTYNRIFLGICGLITLFYVNQPIFNVLQSASKCFCLHSSCMIALTRLFYCPPSFYSHFPWMLLVIKKEREKSNYSLFIEYSFSSKIG